MKLNEFEETVEEVLGESIESVRNTTIDKRRQDIEMKHKKSLHFFSHFPFIGRGSVLRKFVVNHKRAEKAFKGMLNRVK